jgi:hypothetical protein
MQGWGPSGLRPSFLPLFTQLPRETVRKALISFEPKPQKLVE